MIARVYIDDIFDELVFTTSRSSGAGGQNVNKVNSKVTLAFDLHGSQKLTDEQKQFLNTKLAKHLTKEGVLQMSSQESRSQLDNKEIVVRKLSQLLQQAFKIEKKRKKTKPTKTSAEKRIKKKKSVSEKKKFRQRPRLD